MADKYLLRVTAGSSYDASTHVVVPVNGPTATPIESEVCTAKLKVRIQNYRGLPHGSPSTSGYFAHAPHEKDQYSLAFTFVPKRSIGGADLVFGNDFDRPVRDRLPYGFGAAFNIVKRIIDPGLEGDVYADRPYLYGPLVSSINFLRVGAKVDKFEIPAAWHEDNIAEGGEGDGETKRQGAGMPDDAAARKKWGLKEENKTAWTWDEGRVYAGDFCNPFLDFNDFSLRLPGFHISALGYLEGKDSLRRSHEFRYVLKDKKSGDVLFVVVLTMVLKEDIEKEDKEAEAAAAKESKPVAKQEAEKAKTAEPLPSNDDDDVD